MKWYLLSTIPLLILFDSCSSKEKNALSNVNEKVFIYRFKSDNQLNLVDTSFLNIEKPFDSRLYKYFVSPLDSNYTYYIFTLSLKEDTLLFYNDTAYLINDSKYEVGKKVFKVKQFLFDDVHTMHEELSIYFTKEYGVLITYFETDLIVDGIFEYDSISRDLVEKILADTTNNLWNWRRNMADTPYYLQK